jgi:hypothetical protein
MTMQDRTFVQDGVVYQDLGNGKVKVVGYADQPQQAGQVFTLPQDPVEDAQRRATLNRTQQDLATRGATAPYDARKAAADAAKAESEAVKAQRDLAAAQATANPAQQKAQLNLANDEVLTAIQNARGKLDAGGGWAAGYAARLPERLQPQSAIDLGGALNTITARLTLDKLAALKQASPTGASGLGSLTEREGALLRDSVAALGQTQSPDVLRENLAAVERHYRNVIALSQGEDYRDPKVAEKYGIVPMPSAKGDTPGQTGGDDSQMNLSLAPAGSQVQTKADPALRGVNAHVRAMVGAGKKPDEIIGYLNRIKPGLGDGVAPSVNEAVKFRAQNPRVPLTRYVIQLENQDIPMSSSRVLGNTLAQSPVGAAAMSAGDAATAFNLPNFFPNPEVTRAAMGQVAADNPASSMAGTLGGGALAGAALEAALPFKATMGGAGLLAPRLLASDALYGAAAGYGTGDGSIGSILGGAAMGAGGGVLGRGAVRGLGSTLKGVTNPDVQYLRQAGVPMTPGQMTRGSGRLGDSLAKREDRLAGYAGVGDSINDLRRKGVVGFNQEAFKQGLEPIGQVGVGNVAEQGIDEARKAVSGSYDNALGGVRVTPDAPFAADYGAARTAGAAIPRTGPEFQHVVDTRVAPFVQQPEINGSQIQDMLQGIKGADFGTDAMGQDASQALGGVGDAITDLVSRQAPDVMPQLNAANKAYRNTSILANAVGKGMNTEGLFTPAQLGMAARENATKYTGKMSAASTDRPFFDLQRAGQNVLPSKVPDSGTAGRIQAGKGIFGAMQNGVRSAVNAPLYSEALQPYIASLLLDRPELARAIGDQIQRRSRVGGLFGTPLLLSGNTQAP